MDLRKDVLYYDALVDFPSIGQENKLYLDKSNGALYYWNGSSYALSGDGKGNVLSVTASAPLASSGGANPNITLSVPSDNTKFLDGTGAYDTVKDSDLSLSDITTNDVSTSKHGFAPKAPNDTTKFLRGDGTWAVPAAGSSSGKFGIADSTGAYTYYTTLDAAMTAAVAGQTIEVFADYTETGSTEIFLKNGVNINGNGHTFTKNTNDGTAIFWMSVTKVDCSILNYNIVRSVGSGAILRTVGYADGTIDFSGTIFNKSGSGSGADFISVTVLNLTTYCSTSSTGISVNGTAQNCIGINTSSGVGFQLQSGTSQNCVGKSDSGIGFVNRGYSLNGSGYSNSGVGFQSESRAVNCVGRSVSSTGFVCYYDIVDNIDCVGISISGQGLSSQGGSCFGCSGYSTSNYGTVLTSGAQHCNFTSKSDGAPSIWAVNVNSFCRVIEGTAYSYWNNAAGYGLRGWGGVMPGLISNVFFKLSNASAPYLFNDNIATSLILRGNTYIGGTAYNPNITQAAVTTQDNQGNIFL